MRNETAREHGDGQGRGPSDGTGREDDTALAGVPSGERVCVLARRSLAKPLTGEEVHPASADQLRPSCGYTPVKKTYSIPLVLLALSITGSACSSTAPESDDALRAGLQVVSDSVDLSSVDMCWSVDGADTLVRLDEEMLDANATRFLNLAVESDLRVAFVAHGKDCSDTPLAELAIDPAELDSATDAALLVSGSIDDGLTGTIIPIGQEQPETTSLRSTCTLGDATASRSTRRGSNGSCFTRAVLWECISVYHGLPDGSGFYANQIESTYDSGWIDCSAPVCPELTE